MQIQSAILFNLRFDAIVANATHHGRSRPRLTLSPPSAGWMNWRFDWGGDSHTVIELSFVFALENIWVWAAAVAHRLLPVTLVIDQEGVLAELCAKWSDEQQDSIRLTLRQVNEDAPYQEYERHVWSDDRARWLRRLGYTFAKRLDANIDAPAWHCQSKFWPEPACYLPWMWPASLAPFSASPWTREELQAWFFTILAMKLRPYGNSLGNDRIAEEISARLRFQFADIQKNAAKTALGMLGIEVPVETEKDRAAFQVLTDLFEEIDDPDKTVENVLNSEQDAHALPEQRRSNRLLLACANMENANWPLHRKLSESVGLFPLRNGLWIRDEMMRPGQLIGHHGRSWIVDWGQYGLSCEGDLLWPRRRLSWYCPVGEPEGFVVPGDPLFRRWRVFLLAPDVPGLIACPCCGYPLLEKDPHEIIDCPLCGWPAYLQLLGGVIVPDQPFHTAEPNDSPPYPTLEESRRYFVAHGDAYAPDDPYHTAWLRRPDVIALRREVIAAFDDWLVADENEKPSLPIEQWTKLDWMPRRTWEAEE